MTDDELHDLYDQWQWEDRNRLSTWSPLYRTFEQWLEERAKAEADAASQAAMAEPEADDTEAAKRAALAATLAEALASALPAVGLPGPEGPPGPSGEDGPPGKTGPAGPTTVLRPPDIQSFEFVTEPGAYGRVIGAVTRYSDGTVRHATVVRDASGRPASVTYKTDR